MTRQVANRREYLSLLTTGLVGSTAGCGLTESACDDDGKGDLTIWVVPDDIDSTPEAEAREITATTTIECPTNDDVLFEEMDTFTQSTSSTPSPRRYANTPLTGAIRLTFNVHNGPTKTEEYSSNITNMEIGYRVNNSIEFNVTGRIAE